MKMLTPKEVYLSDDQYTLGVNALIAEVNAKMQTTVSKLLLRVGQTIKIDIPNLEVGPQRTMFFEEIEKAGWEVAYLGTEHKGLVEMHLRPLKHNR